MEIEIWIKGVKYLTLNIRKDTRDKMKLLFTTKIFVNMKHMWHPASLDILWKGFLIETGNDWRYLYIKRIINKGEYIII